MQRLPAAAAALSLALAGCGGEKALTLPADPVDRAATCAIVAAAEARQGASVDVSQPLPIEAQGRILHYPLLAASEGGSFSADVANQVNARMQALQDEVTSGKWQDLVPACTQAFPATAAAGAVKLPAARFEAQLACVELTEFLANALESQQASARAKVADYRTLRRDLNDAMGAGMRARAGGDLEAQRRVRNEGLAAAAQLGNPVAVAEACRESFG